MKNLILKSSFLSVGFRPFFTLTLVGAILSVLAWVLQYSGLYSIDSAPLLPSQWHANEMIFGFLYAAVVGFLLTASANWTGTRGIHGKSLLVLFLLFVVTRIVFWTMPFGRLEVYQLIGIVVPLYIVFHLGVLFIKTKNLRNLILLVPLSVLAISQILILSSKYVIGYEIAIFSIRFLVVVIAGRVIPFFTKSVLKIMPRWENAFFEKATIATAFLLIFEPFYYDFMGSYLWVGVTTLALLLNIYRLVNWQFISSSKVGILFILYVAYAWLPLHFFLNLAVHFNWISPLGRPELHSLVYGCMGMMILGIVNRVTLGHTGRPIRANFIALTSYAAIFMGSLVRVFGPIIAPQYYLDWIKLSGGLWILAFIAISVAIGPMLFTVRVDGKEH